MIHAPMMRFVLLLATVASVSCANDRPVWASQGAQDDPAELKRAGELERSGKYDEAIAIYRTLAAKDGPTAVASRRGPAAHAVGDRQVRRRRGRRASGSSLARPAWSCRTR